jgi:hypothetical protein
MSLLKKIEQWFDDNFDMIFRIIMVLIGSAIFILVLLINFMIRS